MRQTDYNENNSKMQFSLRLYGADLVGPANLLLIMSNFAYSSITKKDDPNNAGDCGVICKTAARSENANKSKYKYDQTLSEM